MRTSFQVDEELHRAIHARAEADGCSVDALLVHAAGEYIARRTDDERVRQLGKESARSHANLLRRLSEG